MRRNIQRALGMLLCAVLAFSLTACGSGGTSASSAQEAEASPSGLATPSESVSEGTTQEGDTYIFTDSTGREVELPRNIEKVASGGPLANIMIYAVKPEVIIGWSSKPSQSAQKYIDEAYWDLPEYGKFYGKSDEFNREALMASNPDVIIDIGEWDEAYKADLNSLQEQLGIPVILVEANLEQNPAAFRTLGELFDEKERAEELAAYCENVISEATEKAASIPEAERKTIYYGEGATGLSTMLKGTIHAQIYDLVGTEIVVNEENAQLQQGGGDISMEQLMEWDPDIIMFAKGSVYADVADDATWNALTAIKNGQYYEIPTEPYNWLGRPPGVNRMIGAKWLGNLVYPEVFEYDIQQEVKDFFKLFYRYDLSDEEVSELLANSTLKMQESDGQAAA